MTSSANADTHDPYSDPLKSLARMLRQHVPELAGHDALIDMFAPGAAMEFPYAPEGVTQRLDSREAMQAHFGYISGLMSISPMRNVQVHRGAGATVVLEFECDGIILARRQPFHQRYVSAITLRDGKIGLYRDYWNPLVVAKALEGVSA